MVLKVDLAFLFLHPDHCLLLYLLHFYIM